FSICRLLTTQRTDSANPPKTKDCANRIDKVNNELAVDGNTSIVTMTKNKPTSAGIYQYLTASFN
ncbi:MAG: hypothetical protein WA749_16300, partial [Gelidibacter sp.]